MKKSKLRARIEKLEAEVTALKVSGWMPAVYATQLPQYGISLPTPEQQGAQRAVQC